MIDRYKICQYLVLVISYYGNFSRFFGLSVRLVAGFPGDRIYGLGTRPVTKFSVSLISYLGARPFI